MGKDLTAKKPKKKKKKNAVIDDAPEDLDENECLLKKALGTWTSLVYEHYHLPPAIHVEEDGTVKYIFTCKCHGTTHTHACKDTNMTNLKNHAKQCNIKAQNMKLKQPNINEVISSYNHGEFCLLHVEWLTDSHHPDEIIEDPGLQRIYHHLNHQVKIHSDTTVGHDIKETFEVLKEHIKVVTLDMIELTKSHTGEYLTQEVMKILKEYNIKNCILGETSNNASVNDKMLDILERLFQQVSEQILIRQHMQICSFAHILNLVVKVILSQFEAKRCPAKSTDADGVSKCRRTQGQASANDKGDESDVDEFVEDDNDELDDEEHAALDELHKELEKEEADDID